MPRDLSHLPDWPARMTREVAAAYLGMSPTQFDGHVSAGRLPKPHRLTPRSNSAWTRRELDETLARLAGAGAGSSILRRLDELRQQHDGDPGETRPAH